VYFCKLWYLLLSLLLCFTKWRSHTKCRSNLRNRKRNLSFVFYRWEPWSVGNYSHALPFINLHLRWGETRWWVRVENPFSSHPPAHQGNLLPRCLGLSWEAGGRDLEPFKLKKEPSKSCGDVFHLPGCAT